MYIVIFGTPDGYFGPFETREAGKKYIADCKSEGRVVSLVKPYAFGKLEDSGHPLLEAMPIEGD